MIRSVCLPVILVILLFAPIAGAAPVPLPSPYEDAVQVLVDPYVSSNHKLEAIRILSKNPYTFDSSEGRRITLALFRQAHYDMEPVRALAINTLEGMAGGRRIDSLMSDIRFEDHGHFIRDFRAALSDLKEGDALADGLWSNRSEDRQRAIQSVAQIAAADPNRFASLPLPLKFQLTTHLEAFDEIEPAMRRHTLVLIEQIGPRYSTRILVRALVDDDVEVRRIIQRFNDAPADRPEHQAIVSAIAQGLVDTNEKLAKSAAKYVPALPDTTMKTAIAKSVAGAAMSGDLEPVILLKKHDINSAMFDKAAYELLELTGRYDHLALLKALRMGGADTQVEKPRAFRALIAGMLSSDDDSISLPVAQFCMTPKSREIAADTMYNRIKEGKKLSPALLRALKLDSDSFAPRLLEIFRTGSPESQRATVHALATIGAKGQAVEAAILPLLRDRDAETRQNAAKILNTPEAQARARLPELLNQIRSNTLSTRHLAARQIDELGIEPKEVTGALVRAVEEGDFAARLGLVSALETANFSSQNALEVLNQTAAAQDAAPRAYARAALREIDSTKAQKEKKP